MRRVLIAAVAAVLGAAVVAPGGAHAQAPEGTALLHGVPSTPVDVYVDGALTFASFQPGASEDLTGFAGTTLTAVEVFAAGADPSSDSPILGPADVPVPADGHNSIVVHLDAAGDATISTFVNNATQTGPGVGRITVRHAAAAPPVDLVLSNGERPLLNLANGGSQELGPSVGTYEIQLAEAGGGLLAGTQTTVESTEGVNLIVYATGSLTDSIVYVTESVAVGVDTSATTSTTTTTTTVPGETTTTTSTTTASTTSTTAPVPVAVNTGSPLGSPLDLTLVVIALGAIVVTGGAVLARRRV